MYAVPVSVRCRSTVSCLHAARHLRTHRRRILQGRVRCVNVRVDRERCRAGEEAECPRYFDTFLTCLMSGRQKLAELTVMYAILVNTTPQMPLCCGEGYGMRLSIPRPPFCGL